MGTGRLTPDARFGHEQCSAIPMRRRQCFDRSSGHITPTARRSDMGWLEPMPLIAVLVLIAIAAAGGFWASGVVQTKKSRTRGPFLVGVVCGVMLGLALSARRRGPGVVNSAGGVAALLQSWGALQRNLSTASSSAACRIARLTVLLSRRALTPRR